MRAGKQPRTSMELETQSTCTQWEGCFPWPRPPRLSQAPGPGVGANSGDKAALRLTLKNWWHVSGGWEGIWLSRLLSAGPFALHTRWGWPGQCWYWQVLEVAMPSLCQGKGHTSRACGDSGRLEIIVSPTSEEHFSPQSAGSRLGPRRHVCRWGNGGAERPPVP